MVAGAGEPGVGVGVPAGLQISAAPSAFHNAPRAHGDPGQRRAPGVAGLRRALAALPRRTPYGAPDRDGLGGLPLAPVRNRWSSLRHSRRRRSGLGTADPGQGRDAVGDVAPPHATFSYEYDFGDSWDHTIDVRSISPIAGDDANPEIPRCTAGARACPPEDAGGTWGYEQLLEAATDPSHEEHESSLTWMGADFDPERFDLEAVNVALELAFQERARAVERDTGG